MDLKSLQGPWRLTIARLLAIILIFSSFFQLPAAGADDIQFYDVNVYSGFSGAISPNSIQMACSSRPDVLMAHFRSNRLPFDAQIVRRIDNLNCHILYEPSIHGFRAHAESQAIRGVFVDIPHMRLLARPGVPLGDSLDIAKALLARAPNTLDVSLGVAASVPRPLVNRSLQAHFPNTRHRIHLRPNPDVQVNSWSQDFIKSGEVREATRLLTPRRIFEGDKANGEQFKALLDALASKRTGRSRISWEGGDLMFVRSPRDPQRLLLFYGDAARPYWADNLSEEEYAYVLRVEFGADEAIYFGNVAPHVDYVVSFLPEQQTALLAQPVTGNLQLAQSAVKMLALTFSAPVPTIVRELETALTGPESLQLNAARIRDLLAQGRLESSGWAMPVDGAAYDRVEAHMKAVCPQDGLACVAPSQLPSLVANHPDLLADWVQMAAVLRAGQSLPVAMFSVIEDQLPGQTAEKERRLRQKAEILERLGFRVIRVPWIGGEMTGSQLWAGVSYANLILIEHTLFIPVFGFGEPEQKLVEEIEPKLPAGYRVVPVLARSALLQNGGVHCVVGLVRGDGFF
jgi:hypothetical protein